ncbi:hypothetical protein DL96DRAFT_1802766 [Flagelloscypha sp. PMI_526]|nr:hypothetical protein DL96DRAFT_1802766 [Flagelloscypha sp. PMI_526]
MASTIPIPKPLATFFSFFPVHTYPAEELFPPRESVTRDTLWVLPSHHGAESVLSSDVECLKWQAYLAYRLPESHSLGLRMDVDKEGALGGELPNLHVPSPKDLRGTDGPDEDVSLADESKAWTALLEGVVHDSLLDAQKGFEFHIREWLPIPYSVEILIPGMDLRSNAPKKPRKLEYQEAIGGLSERLGTSKWFLGTENPTSLDALLFAYIHLILDLPLKNPKRTDVRMEVTKRVNLVAWERRVRGIVRGAWASHLVK